MLFQRRMWIFLKITFFTDESEDISIVESKDVLNNFDLKISSSYVASNFLVKSSTIKKLETLGLALTSSCQLVSELELVFGKLYYKS